MKEGYKYFEVLEKGNWYTPLCGEVYTTLGPPTQSEQLYRWGKFPYIGLKKGAEKLFKKDKIETLIKLIEQAHRKEDVEILMLANKSKKVQEAGEEKIQVFSLL